MADYAITSTARRVVYSGSAGTGPYSFNFPVLTSSDLAVYKDTTLLSISTHYTVSIGASGTGTVTLGSAADSGNTITIVGARTIERSSDFVTAGDLLASSLNTELDSQTIFVQQVAEDTTRGIKAPVTDPTSIDMTLPAKASRLGKLLSFDETTGDPLASEVLGQYEGNWAASTAYDVRDIVKDTGTNNIFLCNTAHTSSGSLPITSNTDAAKWDLLVDAASATTSAAAAAASETSATASATSATASATSATASKTAAAASETAAASSETAAATSATNASNSASSASTSASNASTSETNAASSESAASTSATNAASSASAASTSATNASNSASAASTSASNAATSETNAAASAASAEAAAASVYWNFDTSTTMADPGTGDVRFNNATIASVTQVAVSASSASTGNPDVSDFVAAWDDSTSTTKGYIVIREAGAPGTTIVFSISGTITDNTTWLQIPVTHVSSAGTLSASDDLYFSFSRTGDSGISSGDLLAANNLSDVDDAATSRSNLSAAASGANTDITSLREVVTAATSGVVESNANFIDTCLVGPSVDGKAWSGKFENGSVWSSLMLATVETSGANAEVNIWDLTAGALASASPLATVTLTGATPTSIAASMGYVIVGTSDQGMHIVDPHDGAWAERAYGWPRSLTASTAPALNNNNVQFVAAGLKQAPANDPRSGGPTPCFMVGYGSGATYSHSIIKDDGNVYDHSGTITSGSPCFISNGFAYMVREDVNDTLYRSIAPIDGITSDGFLRSNLFSSLEPIQSDTAIEIRNGLVVSADADGLLVGTDAPIKNSLEAKNQIVANINTTYNTGFFSGSAKLAALANSKTADRSGNSNTLTESGTVPSAAVETGAELLGYGVFSASNYLSRANDADFAPLTDDMTVTGWFRCSASPAVQVLFRYGANGTNTNSWLIHVNANGTLRYMNRDSAGNNAEVDSPSIEDDVWHQFCGTTDRTSDALTLYIDGVAVGSASTAALGSITNTTQLLEIGCQNTGGTPSEPADSTKLALLRMSKSAMSATQVKQMYEAEKGMFVANAKCLLQGAGNAVLDARIDPLTGNYIVTQSDTQDIFDGLAIETERTIATGGSTFEHGLLWGDAVAEINDANLFSATPATDQRQVNEMVRSMAAELPAGVDLSKAKAFYEDYGKTSANLVAGYNIESIARNGTGDWTITFAIPFKTDDYISAVSANGDVVFGIADNKTPGSVNIKWYNSSGSLTDARGTAVFFGELENE